MELEPVNLMSRGALDPRWTRHHTPVAASFMLATIDVVRKTPSTEATRPTYNQATGKWSTTSFETVVSNVKARIQPFGIMGDMVVGQDTTGRRLMRVQIEDIDTGIHLDDIIIVKTCPDNPELTKYTIEVRGAISSSNAWLTDLVCEADMKADT
jgi:hypothetical protein